MILYLITLNLELFTSTGSGTRSTELLISVLYLKYVNGSDKLQGAEEKH